MAQLALAPPLPNVVVSGHSHKAATSTRNGVLFLNPGSAGPRRFKLPVSVAELHIDGDTAVPRIVELDCPPAMKRR
jgi:predicted phosphodiesterase